MTYTVTLGDKWRLYTTTVPIGTRPLGTVTRAGYDTGALLLVEATGLYVQCNARALRNLDQRAVAAAIAQQYAT